MSLRSLSLKYKYRSSMDRIYEDFYKPCLQSSVRYDRAVGYFTSHSLNLVAEGLETFIDNNGMIRIIANPHLTKEDVEAIDFGYKAKQDVVTEALIRELKKDNLLGKHSNFPLLAWLIYKGQLDIKIAYPDNNGLYHEKFGLFIDAEGNTVAFSGSANETVGGLKKNFEKIDVFFMDSEQERIKDMVIDFEQLWKNKTPNLQVMDLPNVVREELTQYNTSYNPIRKKLSKKKDITPRPYQVEAIQAVKENGWHGILEMATGTGKTYTSLFIADAYLKEHKRLFLVIIAPFIHLVDQWITNLHEMGYSTVTRCSGLKKSWSSKLSADIRDFNIGILKKHAVVVTYRTAASDLFNSHMQNVRCDGMLIADECHNFAVSSMRENKLSHFSSKIGLSATPDRWWDDQGTAYNRSYFKRTVYTYDLKMAIDKGALTNYKYYPIRSDLTEEEIEEYERLGRRLVILFQNTKENSSDIAELNRQRSLIISKAENKKEILFQMLKEEDVKSVFHTLVYCAPGQIEEITSGIAKLGYRVHRFDYNVSYDDRQNILKAFEEGKIQILVAIKCLDEGVDIPSTETAYFLASTSNPREFVQRRGRILRPSDNKVMAKIYDFITLPTSSDRVFKSVAKKEMPRFTEFSMHAVNKYTARSEVSRYLEPYNLNYLMDKLPWEVYREYSMEGDEKE